LAKKFIISKTNTGPHPKNVWGSHKSDTKSTRKKRNAANNLCWQLQMCMEQKYTTSGLYNSFIFG